MLQINIEFDYKNKKLHQNLFGHLMQFVYLTIFSNGERRLAVIFNFQLSISSFFTCVSAHTLVQEEKSDRNYKKDYRTDCKGDKNIVHTLNKKVVERP